MSRARLKTGGAAAVVAVGAAAGLSACGVTTNGAMQELGSSTTPPAARTISGTTPDRPSGEVLIDGRSSALTTQAIDAYKSSGGATALTVHDRSEEDAFAALCAGDTDLVDAARTMTRAEQARCGANGRTPVLFTVAADAVVLATAGETDTGADCLTVPQVRQAFRAGSPVYDWSQLGFDRVTLGVAGPTQDARAFGLFGRLALDAEAPSLTDVRSDYHAGSPAQAIAYVTGDPADARLAQQRDLAAARARAAATRATAAAESDQEATAELVAARRDRRKGIHDHRPAAQQARDRARVARAEAAHARAAAYHDRARSELTGARQAAELSGAAARRQAALRGRIAVLSYRDYAAVADRVRALEVSQSGGAAASCAFPSAESISSGTYPLGQPLVLATTSDELRRTEVTSFLASYLRRSAALATAAGLVPVPAPTVQQELSWLRDPAATERTAPSDPDQVKPTS